MDQLPVVSLAESSEPSQTSGCYMHDEGATHHCNDLEWVAPGSVAI